MSKQKVIAFDLDDVICYRPTGYEHYGPDKYDYCKPYPKVIPLFSMFTWALYEKNPNIRITTRSVSNWGNIFLIFTIIQDL